MEEENSSRMISLVVYPIVNFGIRETFSDICMAITVPIKNGNSDVTIQMESTPNLYISFQFSHSHHLQNGIKNDLPMASRPLLFLYERQSLPARPFGYLLLCLLLHRPGYGVSVILELDLACRAQPDGSFAGMVHRR